jgi:transposase
MSRYAYEVYNSDTNKYLGLVTNCNSEDEAIRKASFIYRCSVRAVKLP